MEDCIDNLGSDKFVTKLDLLKGNWQVPFTARAAEISAFVTPDNFLQYRVMAFGLQNAPATFQRQILYCQEYKIVMRTWMTWWSILLLGLSIWLFFGQFLKG